MKEAPSAKEVTQVFSDLSKSRTLPGSDSDRIVNASVPALTRLGAGGEDFLDAIKAVEANPLGSRATIRRILDEGFGNLNGEANLSVLLEPPTVGPFKEEHRKAVAASIKRIVTEGVRTETFVSKFGSQINTDTVFRKAVI